jgi:hypothetical protein
VDLDTHSSGFTSDESPVKECGTCGLVWRVKVEHGETTIDVIKQAEPKK